MTTMTMTMYYAVRLLSFTGLVSAAGGFAPSIDAPIATTEPPPTTTLNAALQPTFLGRHNATVNVHAGDTAALNCHVLRLGDKTVSWARRRGGDFHILTVGFHTYHNDERYSLSFEYPDNWKLQIRYVQKRDEGLYECQISTHPPQILRVYLSVSVPNIEVRDPRGAAVNEAFYREDSTVGLQCVVLPAHPTRPVRWSKDGRPLTTQPERGIRVDTSLMGSGLSSWLHIARAVVTDTGNYTCSAGETITASVRVHVLDGESSAAMQHSTTDGATPTSSPCWAVHLLLLAPLLLTIT
ncbi:hemicentin-1-like [Homarus americanus]|uniref:hemicentin-1-like n=1 Tax=Homarus americanus TaxID=6706 RepID=UPI001C485136|nr:hemicentin-1-like [Homarus americanus]